MELNANTIFRGISWNPHTRCKNSMEFHGMEFQRIIKTWLQYQIPWNSIKSLYPVQKFHGIPLNYESSMELDVTRNSMEFYKILNTNGIDPRKAMELFPWTRSAHFQMTSGFHGIPWNITWTSGVAKSYVTKVYGIIGNSEIAVLNDINVLWTCREYSIISLQLSCRKIKYQQVPWNLEIANSNDIGVAWTSVEYSIEVHGTLESPNQISRT